MEERFLSNCPDNVFRQVAGETKSAWLENSARDVTLTAILDGSDLYAASHSDRSARWKEQVHRDVCQQVAMSFGGDLLIGDLDTDTLEMNCWFRDAAMLRFAHVDNLDDALWRGIAAGLSIHRFLAEWNNEHCAAWEEQVHSRIGISTLSWSATLRLAKQAQRGETIIAIKDWNGLPSEVQHFLRAAGMARTGLLPERLDELSEKFDEILDQQYPDPALATDQTANEANVRRLVSTLPVGQSGPGQG